MHEAPRSDVTQILIELNRAGPGDPAVSARLYEVVYDEMRRIAGRLMRGERPGHTLQPTALVHEAYIRLVDQTRVEWQDRVHFYAVAARIMRRILVDHARRRARLKRGGAKERVTWDEALGLGHDPSHETLALDDALTRLSKLDPRMERIVELRVFAGMTVRETAHALGVSDRTVNSDWMVAKQWLTYELAS